MYSLSQSLLFDFLVRAWPACFSKYDGVVVRVGGDLFLPSLTLNW